MSIAKYRDGREGSHGTAQFTCVTSSWLSFDLVCQILVCGDLGLTAQAWNDLREFRDYGSLATDHEAGKLL